MVETQYQYRNILIIDDDEDDSALIAESLKEIVPNIRCTAVSDGREGLQLLRKPDQHIDLIFLDLHMPRMNGLEFLKVIKIDPVFNSLPIIICTESKFAKEIDECKQLGVSTVITKPTSFIILKYEIRAALKELSNNLVS
jgi:CheY-like chemotaxis protein